MNYTYNPRGYNGEIDIYKDGKHIGMLTDLASCEELFPECTKDRRNYIESISVKR